MQWNHLAAVGVVLAALSQQVRADDRPLEQIAEARAAVERLGGRFEGPMGASDHRRVVVTLHRATDDDLKSLPQMPLPFDLHLGPKFTEKCFADLMRFDKLRSLHLRGANWTGKRWVDLGKLERLTGLHVHQAKNLGDTDWKPLSRLTTLSLSGTAVSGAGLSDLPNLRVLYLSGSKITDAGLADLRGLKYLTTLHLDGTPMTDAGLKGLGGLESLSELSLEETAVTGSGFRAFQGNKTLAKLMFNRSGATDEGMKGVRELTGLVYLRVMYTNVGDDGITELTGLTNLKFLLADDSAVTLAGAARFRNARPGCELYANGRRQ